MKAINRRSFFGHLAGAFGLGYMLTSEAIQIPAMWERHKQLKKEVTIKIDASSMESTIEKHMLKILEELQVRASEEGAWFLLGR